MEIKMTPISLVDIPGMKQGKPHDDFAKQAIEEFADSDMEAAVLELPHFDVSMQTVVGLLRQHGLSRNVVVKTKNLASRKTPEDFRRKYGYAGTIVFLTRKPE